MIILIGGEKGGTGKTTISVNLATLHALKNKEILLVDADKQNTSTYWSAVRDENPDIKRLTTIQKRGKSLAKDLKDLSEKYETILVDAGGQDSVELRAAMSVADRMFIPLAPSQFDTWTLDTMAELYEQVQVFNPNLTIKIIANKTSTNPYVKDVEDLKELLEEYEHFELCSSVIRQRGVLPKSSKVGLCVKEYASKNESDQKSVKELNSLYKEVFHG